MNVANQLRGKQARSAGKAGEALTKAALYAAGYRFIERVHTPWKVLRRPDPDAKGGSRIVGAVPEDKVSGDFRAVDPRTGRSVLCEAKFDGEDRVIWSDLEEHQIAALNEHSRCGGESLFSAVIGGRAWLLRWPIQDFGPGCSIRLVDGELRIFGKGKGPPG